MEVGVVRSFSAVATYHTNNGRKGGGPANLLIHRCPSDQVLARDDTHDELDTERNLSNFFHYVLHIFCTPQKDFWYT